MDNIFFNYLAPFIVIFLGIVLVLCVVLLWKVRQIHIACFQLRSDTSNIRNEIESLFSQIQALFALERKLGLSEALPPMRGWAGSPDFLLSVAEGVVARKPKAVMECSSGVSTLVVARCLQLNGSGHVYSLEHDPEYAEKTRKLLASHSLEDWATVLDAPLQINQTDTPWYSEDEIPQELPAIEMLIVDGPPMQTAPLARFPALPRLMPRMAERFIVFVDDADRDDETEMIRRWRDLFPHLKQRNGYCEKGLIILESQGKQT